jgi:hypothetical protein
VLCRATSSGVNTTWLCTWPASSSISSNQESERQLVVGGKHGVRPLRRLEIGDEIASLAPAVKFEVGSFE